MDKQSAFGLFALFAWLPVSLWMFTRFRPRTAAMVTLFGATLLLPERVTFDLPVVPELDKQSAGALAALVGCLWRLRAKLKGARVGHGIDVCWVALLVSTFFTVIANGDPLTYGPTKIPGLSAYDAISVCLRDALTVAIPFFLARALIATQADLLWFLRVVVVAGLLYSIPMIYEVIFSPQLHRMVYGFHPHAFATTRRMGGYRPNVFMLGGLDLARFYLIVAIAATALYRMRVRAWRYLPPMGTFAYVCFMVLLMKSFGLWVLSAIAIPVMVMTSMRTQLRVAVLCVAFVMAYPLLNVYELVPKEQILDWAADFSDERMRSLQVRFDQEDALLEQALKRPLFGWGPYARNRVYDPKTGEDLSVTDGLWVKSIGVRGFVGWIFFFGLFAFPVVMCWRRLRRGSGDPKNQPLVALALTGSLLAVDLLPNGLHDYLHFIVSGALAGGVYGLAGKSKTAKPASAVPSRAGKR